MYWEYDKDGLQRQEARWRHWKAVKAPYTKPVELLSTDVGETHDVVVAHPDIAAKFENYFRTARTDSPDWPMKPKSGNAQTSAASAL